MDLYEMVAEQISPSKFRLSVWTVWEWALVRQWQLNRPRTMALLALWAYGEGF